MLEDLGRRLAQAQAKKPSAFLIAFLIGTLLLAPGILNLIPNVEPSLEKVLPQETEEVALMNQMRTDFGADMMYVLVHTEPPVADARNEQFLAYTDLLAERMRTIHYIRSVQGPADLVIQELGHLPDDTRQIERILAQHPQTPQYLSPNNDFAVLVVRSDTGASAEIIAQVTEEIEGAVAALEPYNPGARIQITGFNAIDKATFEVIITDFLKITLLSFALVALVVFAVFKTVRKAGMPLLITMVAVLWTMGVVGYLGLTITVVSMVAAAMILGLGINYGILVTHRYGELREEHSKARALEETMREMLRALLGGSLTTMAGFLALLFGVLPAMKTLGIILAIGIFITLTGAVLLLPALLYTLDKGTPS